MQTTLQTPETFGMLPIRSEGDQLVRLRDVADVELGPESTDTIVSFNGSQGTFIGITPTPSANPLTTAAEVTKEIDAIRPTLPKGMNVEIVYDASNFISASIEEVFKTIGEAALIVVVVILLFLGSFRSVLIPIVTIPLSLIGVCFFLYALGYSINLLTLLAMVLAIGLVVDDAIVVLENIHRHIEEGLKPVDAAIVGMKEIFLPIVSMTITLAAVYAPIGFTTGPDRLAVPGVRLHARRRGDHLRHRRGHALADDVVEAAEASWRARRGSPPSWTAPSRGSRTGMDGASRARWITAA